MNLEDKNNHTILKYRNKCCLNCWRLTYYVNPIRMDYNYYFYECNKEFYFSDFKKYVNVENKNFLFFHKIRNYNAFIEVPKGCPNKYIIDKIKKEINNDKRLQLICKQLVY